jgi:hypothetical protein
VARLPGPAVAQRDFQVLHRSRAGGQGPGRRWAVPVSTPSTTATSSIRLTRPTAASAARATPASSTQFPDSDHRATTLRLDREEAAR